MQKKRRKIWILIVIIAVLLAGLGTGYVLYRRQSAEPVSVETTLEYAPENVVFFYQKDDAWKSDKLGDSKYTMNDSGCLTCCMAAVLQMQGFSVDGLSADADAGEVNRFFSEHGVYDSEGNLQWDVLEQVTGVSVTKKDASELADGELDEYLEDGCYPIVRVRVGGTGSYHYVLIVSSTDGEYWCMDPLEEEETLVPLSDFGGKIYAVRFLQWESRVLNET
ncbi:hypothetical protein [Ruminococcus sp.]|uniref:hypothetical protein n=1 Tax=Ruminococcus sp. TaxID=41978 RepID=UPI0025D70BDA|nr:hypothetical protein [Ruminococcus sp.]